MSIEEGYAQDTKVKELPQKVLMCKNETISG